MSGVPRICKRVIRCDSGGLFIHFFGCKLRPESYTRTCTGDKVIVKWIDWDRKEIVTNYCYYTVRETWIRRTPTQ